MREKENEKAPEEFRRRGKRWPPKLCAWNHGLKKKEAAGESGQEPRERGGSTALMEKKDLPKGEDTCNQR